MRTFTSAALSVAAALAALGLAAPAHAVPPTHTSYDDNGPLHIEIPGFCVDTVVADGYTDEHMTTFYNSDGSVRRVQVSGKATVTFSDPTTGLSFKANSSGPGTFYPDGTAVFRGGEGIFLTPDGALGNARGRAYYTPDGTLVRFSGTVKDVCAELGTTQLPTS